MANRTRFSDIARKALNRRLAEKRVQIVRRAPDEQTVHLSPEVIDCETPPAWFHAAQLDAWKAESSTVAICAGWQSGKTVFLPEWLKREIQRRGPGDYGAFSTTRVLMQTKLIPEIKKAFRGFGKFRDGNFEFSEDGARSLWGEAWTGEPTVIYLRHASEPDALESATYKGLIWDETGMAAVPEASYRVAQSRVLAYRGRMCLASRPYGPGWFQKLVQSRDALVTVINFPTWMNPRNPAEDDPHWDNLRRELPAWRFQMLYVGLFTRPAGAIYDTFDWDSDTCEPFAIPDEWRKWPGVDFGNVNMAGVIVAEDPRTKILYVIDEYLADNPTDFKGHARHIQKGHGLRPGAAGSHTEEGWREAFRMHGLALDEPPVNDVEVQIGCVYAELANKRLVVFRSCTRTIDNISSYTRELDDNEQPTEKILNKASYHLADALRYIITKLRPPKTVGWAQAFAREHADVSGNR